MHSTRLHHLIDQHRLWCNDRSQGSRLELVGENLAGAILDRVWLQGSRLDNVNLKGATLRGAVLHKLEATNVRFDGAELDGVELDDAVVTDCSFRRANLAGAQLGYARWTSCDFTEANLHGAILAKSTWRDVTLTGAKLTHCNLLRWHVTGGDLRRCDFEGSDLTRAAWQELDARGVNLEGAALVRMAVPRSKLGGVRGRPLLVEEIVAGEMDLSAVGDGSRMVPTHFLALLLGDGLGEAALTSGEVLCVHRHRPWVTEAMLEARLLQGIDPLTGTSTDAVHGGRHLCGDHASRFETNAALLKADASARQSPAYAQARSLASAAGLESFGVELPLAQALDADYEGNVMGLSLRRAGQEAGAEAADFGTGCVKAIYARVDGGGDHLRAIYPVPGRQAGEPSEPDDRDLAALLVVATALLDVESLLDHWERRLHSAVFDLRPDVLGDAFKRGLAKAVLGALSADRYRAATGWRFASDADYAAHLRHLWDLLYPVESPNSAART